MKRLKNWQVTWGLVTGYGNISFQYVDGKTFNASKLKVKEMTMMLKILSSGNEWYFDEDTMEVSAAKR